MKSIAQHPDTVTSTVRWGDDITDPGFLAEQARIVAALEGHPPHLAYVAEQRRFDAARRNPGSDPEVIALGRALRAVFRKLQRRPQRRARTRTPHRSPPRSTTRRATADSGGDEGPPGDGDPPLVAPAGAPESAAPALLRGVAAIVVSDQTSLDVIGMDDRQFRDFVREHSIPHRVWRRHVFAQVFDVLAALGLGEMAPRVEPAPSFSVDEAQIIELAARRRS